MIVSILQLMGLSRGKPIQSRPVPEVTTAPVDETAKPADRVTKKRQSTSGSALQQKPSVPKPGGTGRDSPLRRQEVNAQNPKPVAKAKTPAMPAAPASPTKASASPGARPAAATKAAVSKAATPPTAARAVPAKPVAAKPVAVKPVAVKPAVAKAVAPKPVVVKAAAAKPTVVTPAAKPVAKSVVQPAKGSLPSADKTKPAVAPAAPAKAVAPAPAAARSKPGRVPASAGRAGRPSRLSQITVPSMAQSVASTAAKSSYTNTISEPVLTPPPFIPVKKDPKLANNWKTKSTEDLTDAEVLAMPDDEYMNDRQMAYFRLKLARLKQEMLSNAGETTEHLREDTVVVPDPADRATIEEEHALELRTRDRERKLLKKIEQSIVRIDAGDYGYCDETGEPIGVGRLLARPTATLSLEAQQRRELKQKMFGD